MLYTYVGRFLLDKFARTRHRTQPNPEPAGSRGPTIVGGPLVGEAKSVVAIREKLDGSHLCSTHGKDRGLSLGHVATCSMGA
jgi:hypothetical protein